MCAIFKCYCICWHVLHDPCHMQPTHMHVKHDKRSVDRSYPCKTAMRSRVRHALSRVVERRLIGRKHKKANRMFNCVKTTSTVCPVFQMLDSRFESMIFAETIDSYLCHLLLIGYYTYIHSYVAYIETYMHLNLHAWNAEMHNRIVRLYPIKGLLVLS